jgi:NAD+ kinase
MKPKEVPEVSDQPGFKKYGAYMNYKNIALISSNKDKATGLRNKILENYSSIELFDAENSKKYDVIVVLGGDGFMLKTIHTYINLNIPFYGINCGTMGFLMNKFNEKEDLISAINHSVEFGINHLKGNITDINNKQYKEIAINEVSLFRSTHQMAKIKIEIDDIVRMEELLSDGVLVATDIGSGAYNFSASGPILPAQSNLLSLMPISPFRPRRWAGAILNDNSKIKFTVLNADDRSVSLMCDYIEFKNIKTAEITIDKKHITKILFHKGLSLKEKIIQEQFSGY